MKRHPLALAAFTLSAFSATQTPASSPNEKSWNTETAIAYALENNADLKAAQFSIQIAEARLEQTGIRPNPRIEAEYSDDFAFNDEGERNVRLGISQSFPMANRLQKEKAVSRVDIAKAKLEVKERALSIARSIREIALEVEVADTRIASLKRLRDQSKELFEFIQSRVEKGEFSSLEANQALLETRALEQEIIRNTDERNHLTHSLAPYLGLPANQEVEFLSSRLIDPRAALPPFDQNIFERHPEFQLAILNAHSAEAEIALAESENWEDITAGLYWRNERSVDQPIGIESDRSLGVGVSIPLPLRKKGTLRAREQRVARDQAYQHAAAAKLRILHEAEHARHEAEDLKKSARVFEENVIRLAKAQMTEMQSAYRDGQISFVALMRSQSQLLELEHDYLDTIESFARARLKLEFALLFGPGLEP